MNATPGKNFLLVALCVYASKFAAQKREAGFAQQNVRIQFDSLLTLARGGRTVSGAICVGSVPPELRTV